MFYLSLYKSIITTFIMLMIIIVGETIIGIVILILGIDINIIRNIGYLSLLVSIVSCAISVYVINHKKIKNKVENFVFYLCEKQSIILITFCFILLLAITIILTKIGLHFSALDDYFLNILLIVISLLIGYIFLKDKSNHQKLSIDYDNLFNYVQTVENCIEKTRIQNHENKNQLVTIEGMLVGKNDRAINYINSILKEKITEEDEIISKLKYIPKGGLKGLLYYKLHQMKNHNIKISIDISKEIETSNFFKLDIEEYKNICRIVGVYLDNAIEASIESKEKQIGIEIYKIKKMITIVISNTYFGKIDIQHHDKCGFSSKGKNRGYGLTLVNKIIKENNKKISQIREINDKYYIQYLNINI